MQNDLISRSELLKALETWGGDVEVLAQYIKDMPTAYDVEKVVDQIHNKYESFLDEIIDNPKEATKLDFLFRQSNIICGIVRNGGKE